jgi:hypothetical protein
MLYNFQKKKKKKSIFSGQKDASKVGLRFPIPAGFSKLKGWRGVGRCHHRVFAGRF